jgi:hypothetical protein
MDAAAHYRHLLTLGREDFLAAAAPVVLVRYRAASPDSPDSTATLTFDDELGARAGGAAEPDLGETMDDSLSHGRLSAEPSEMELYPLAKKHGASFRDRITIGRTANNDVVIADHSVSRLHAYVRRAGDTADGLAEAWLVADAGSKNGSWVNDVALGPRREIELPLGAVVRFGDVRLTFYRSGDLFDMLGGDHGRR